MKNQLLYLLSGFCVLFNACNSEEPVKNPADIPDFEACLEETAGNTFDIVTWNLKQFPVEGRITIESVAELIRDQDPDLIAVQEIVNPADFDLLLEALPGWDGELYIGTDLNLGFLLKIEETTAAGEPVALFKDETFAFPRAPLLWNVRHQTGLEIFVINIHLKCCEGTENEVRRREAVRLLKKYLDEKYPENKVVVLGDYNDEILGSDSSGNVFYPFISDSLNYSFADMLIAEGNTRSWSYPSWPSHIDHILITNELFDRTLEVVSLTPDYCDQRYFTLISDHRPLMIRIK